jgi:hypothetical protein
VKPGIVDTQVLDAGEHLHLAILEHGAMDPAGGLAKAVAHLALLALEQPDLALGASISGVVRPPRSQLLVDAPLLEPVIAMAFSIRRSSLLHQEFGHVEADAAGADDRHLLAHRLVIPQHIQIAQHLGVLDARNVGGARADAGGEDHLVKTAAQQALGTLALAQIELDAALLSRLAK